MSNTSLKEWIQPQLIIIAKATIEGGIKVGADGGPDQGLSTAAS